MIVITVMVEGAVVNQITDEELDPAELAWQRIVRKLYDIRFAQQSFSRAGEYLQRFGKEIRNRVKQLA